MTATAVVQRLLPASAEVVFDAWLNVSALTEFLCPDPARAAFVECDPRVCGRLRIVMAYPESTSEVLGSTSSWIGRVGFALAGRRTAPSTASSQWIWSLTAQANSDDHYPYVAAG